MEKLAQPAGTCTAKAPRVFFKLHKTTKFKMSAWGFKVKDALHLACNEGMKRPWQKQSKPHTNLLHYPGQPDKEQADKDESVIIRTIKQHKQDFLYLCHFAPSEAEKTFQHF